MVRAFVLTLILSTPALATEDMDGSLNNLPLALRGTVADRLTDNLRDPESAQVRRVRVGVTRDGLRMVCGEITAKNGSGGDGEFEPFALTTMPNGKQLVLNPLTMSPELRVLVRHQVALVGC